MPDHVGHVKSIPGTTAPGPSDEDLAQKHSEHVDSYKCLTTRQYRVEKKYHTHISDLKTYINDPASLRLQSVPPLISGRVHLLQSLVLINKLGFVRLQEHSIIEVPKQSDCLTPRTAGKRNI